MSLGLGDLKKRNSTSSTASKTQARNDTNWSSQTARPWDASGLVRGPKARRRLDSEDGVMNDEWATTHTSQYHYFESFNVAKLEQLQEAAQMASRMIEGKIKRATSGPLTVFKSVLKLVKK